MRTRSHVLTTWPMKFDPNSFLNIKTTSRLLLSLGLVGSSPSHNLVVYFVSVSCPRPNLPKHSKVSIVRPLSSSFLLFLFGFFFKRIRIQTDSFQETFCSTFLHGWSQLDLPLPLPTLISFLRMGNREVMGFFCTVIVGGKRLLFH